MRSRSKLPLVVGLALALYACGGGSGGGGGERLAGDLACPGGDCEADDDASPGPEATPAEPSSPPAAPPLTCGADDACPPGYRCVDDPAASCDPEQDASCPGTCVLGEELPECGDASSAPCPEGYACVDDPADDCMGGPSVDCPGACRPRTDGECSDDADCPQLEVACGVCADGTVSCPQSRCDGGTCTVDVKPCPERPRCGGIAGLSCEPGFQCIDDPSDDCDPNGGGADCGGICVSEEPQPLPCDGFAGLACPPGFTCIDAPNDGCDPERGDADCGGICVDGGEEPRPCGGVAGEICPPGFACVDEPNDDCGPEDGGADCPGVCKVESSGECTSDRDCPPLRAPCAVCPDGMEACPFSVCEGGRCNAVVPSCPTVPVCGEDGSGCGPGEICVLDPNLACDPATGAANCGGVCVPDGGSRSCGGIAGDTCPPGYLCADDRGDDCEPDAGGSDCPGLCVIAPPTECRSDEECAHVLAPCSPCPDGTYACPRAECLAGMCHVMIDPCGEPGFCGGFPGFPCPPGLTCIDDPGDDCDPLQGGADCAGKCVRQEEPQRCGGLAGMPCPDGFECLDDPQDDCAPPDGADCGGICRPAPNPPCASDADCVAIGAPCRICPDGAAACPRSLCENGECRVDFETCAGEER